MNKASYDISELNKLAPEISGKTRTIGEGGLELTLELILKTVNDNIEIFKPFANSIKGDSLEETAYNIWHWIKTETKYVKDTPGTEEIRTPQRLFSDKLGDCDDYSIFAATILKALGYEPFFYIVAFHGSQNYGHIYAGVENIVIDGVMPVYNKHPEGITKTMLLKLNGSKQVITRSPKTFNNISMLIQSLSGLQPNEQTELISSEYSRLLGLGMLSEIEKEDLNKIRVLKLLEGNAHRDFITELMPVISGIDSDLNVFFENQNEVEEIEKLLDEYETLQGLGDIEGLNGFFSKLKTKIKELAAKRKATVKRIVTKAKEVSKKVTGFVKKVGLAPARGAILLLLKLNVFKWGSRLWLSYIPEAKAKEYGFDMEAFKKLVEFRIKFENFFVKGGGKKEAIKNAVSSRGAKKAKEKYGLSGLGVVTAAATGAATGAAVTASSGFLAFLAKIWAPIKGFFSKMFNKVKESKIGTAGKALISKFKDAEIEETMPENLEEFSEDDINTMSTEPDTDKKTNLLPLLIAGIAAAAFLL